MVKSDRGANEAETEVGSPAMAMQEELAFGSESSAKDERSKAPQQFGSFSEISAFIWSIADLMRGDFKRHEYGQVVLPFTLLRRLDCVLAPTKKEVLKKDASLKEGTVRRPFFEAVTGVRFFNTSKLDLETIANTGQDFAENLNAYIDGFDEDVRDIFQKRFRIQEAIDRLERGGILLLVLQKFVNVDLHPNSVDNHMMGSIFEELIRKFAEASNETAGEHFTPRDVIRLMVDLLFSEDEPLLTGGHIVRTLYDPACGTGGMLSVAEEALADMNPRAKLEVFGQELNDESYAICKADMMIKGQEPKNIAPGNSFTEDGHSDGEFHYMLSNPPFGVEWKKIERKVRDEHEKGKSGRFAPGLPRISDGSLLFLMHMVSKMKDAESGEGARFAIVFNGSPLFTGAAGSGESEIRRWLLENDLLEAIIGLPDQLFFNTGISTYVWIVNNRKRPARKNKVQLIDGTELFEKMRKSLGDKRKEISDAQRKEIVRLYLDFVENDKSKIFDTEDFGFHRITVERPLKLAFVVTPERIEQLVEQKAFQKLATSKKKKPAEKTKEIEAGKKLQEAIVEVLRGMDGTQVWKDRAVFRKDLKAAIKKADIKLAASIEKVILKTFGEQDETAVVCKKKDEIEPDSDLRDYEHVPLKESIADYFAREVKPHVPDAWIDESKTKVGYEIPFTRFFYKYVPPRPLEEIQKEISGLETQIQSLLAGVME